MEKDIKEVGEIVKKIKKVNGVLEKVYEELDRLDIGDELALTLKEINKTEEGKKLTKKQRREMVLNYLDKKFPNLSKQLDEFDMVAEAITIKVNDAKEKIEDAQMELDEIESDQEELQQRIDDLR